MKLQPLDDRIVVRPERVRRDDRIGPRHPRHGQGEATTGRSSRGRPGSACREHRRARPAGRSRRRQGRLLEVWRYRNHPSTARSFSSSRAVTCWRRSAPDGQDAGFRRAREAPARGRRQQARRHRQGDARPEGPQRRARQEVRRADDHQRRRHDRPRHRARRPFREHGRPAREGSRDQDQRRRRRRDDHRDGARPGAGPRGPPQRRRRRQPDVAQARHREGRGAQP